MDHRDLEFRFAVSEAGEFEGYAVLWGQRNLHNEIYLPGTFKRSLAEHRANGTFPAMHWAHRSDRVPGVWTEIREDAKGLYVRGKLLLDTTDGKDIATIIRERAATGLSIGFRAAKSLMQRGVRIIRDLDLAEISVVSNPSANLARISAYRHGRPVEGAAAFVDACRKARCALVVKGH
ncbi:HK97 family phage prohead protease [Consotaella aegiceratis]|uniref:HK97 family phage prohead protease n=1 Tax=Consotaella aegiceratis TaxID=3097961 RepID=UPI002F42CEE8